MKHKTTKKQVEKLARIPSAWTEKHNWALFAMLLALLFFWLNRLMLPQNDAVRSAHEVFQQVTWLGGGTVVFLIWALLWHKRRLAEIHGLKLALDGRQDDVFNAILLCALSLFMGGWSIICSVNPMPTEQRPESVYTVQEVSFPGKGMRVRLRLEPSAPTPYVSLRLKFLPFKGKLFHAQDKIYLNYTRGKLGFWHVAALHWQPKDSVQSIRLYPNPEKLPD